MRRTFIAAALLVAALVFSAGAGAVNSITLRLGDEFAVNNTHLLCAVQISKSLIPGEKLVACFYATAKGPVPKTYTVALAVNGEAALGRIGSNGKLQVVMKRGGCPGPRQGGTERQGALHTVGTGNGASRQGHGDRLCRQQAEVRGQGCADGRVLQARTRRRSLDRARTESGSRTAVRSSSASTPSRRRYR